MVTTWQLLLPLCGLLPCIPFVNMAFYPQDMKSFQKDQTDLHKDGYGSYAMAMKMAAVSHLRYNDIVSVSMVLSMTSSTIAQMGQSKIMFIPDLERIMEYMRYDRDFDCLRKVHESVLLKSEQAMSDIAAKESGSSSISGDFPDVAPSYVTSMPGVSGAIKMAFKGVTLKYDMKNTRFIRFAQLTKSKRILAGKGTRAFLGPKLGGHAAKIGGKVFAKFLVPLGDFVTFGISMDTFIRGIQQKNTKMIVGGTVGMVGSVVGLTFFLLCVFKGAAFAAVWGPIGFVVGLLFMFAGLAISLFWPVSAQEIHEALMERLKEVTKASEKELGPIYDFLQKLKKSHFNDVYVVNQAALYYGDSEGSATRNTPLTFKENSGQYQLSFRERKAMKSISGAAQQFFRNASILHNGFMRTFISPNGLSEETLGFDFNGLFTPNSQYKGVSVFVYRNMVEEVIYGDRRIPNTFKGIDIDLTGDPKSISHHIVIDRHFDVASGQTVKIRTGPGHDSLCIDGVIAGREKVPVLDADLGEGENTLSFMGSYKKPSVGYLGGKVTKFAMLGFYFDSGSGELSYRNPDWVKTPMGTVKGVKIFVGSPRPDIIFLSDSGGPDDYQEGDTTTAFDKYKLDHFTAVKMFGIKTFVIDMTTIPKNKRREFTIIDSTIDDPSRKISKNLPGHYPFTTYLFICFDEEEGMTLRRMVYKDFTLYIFRDPDGSGHLKEMIRVYIKTPRWPEIQFISKQDRSFYTAWNNMQLTRHVKYELEERIPNYMFTPIHEVVFPVYLPDGKNITITGATTTGTNKNDFLRLSCRETDDHQSNFKSGTWTIDMAGGTDHICIGRDFLDMCVIDFKGPNTPKEVLLMKVSGGSVEFRFEYEDNGNQVSGKDGKLIVNGAEKIINEYGQVLYDIQAPKYGEGEDLNVIVLYSIETRQRMGLPEEEDGESDRNCSGEGCEMRRAADALHDQADEDAQIEEILNDASVTTSSQYCDRLKALRGADGKPIYNID